MFEFNRKGGNTMVVENIHVGAVFKVIDMQDKAFQSFRKMKPGLSRTNAEMLLDAVNTISSIPVGNGFLTVTTELREA
jgi:hypothetical protein